MRNLQQLQAKIAKPMLVMTQPNLFYLSGFSGSLGMLIITRKKVFFITDQRYVELARGQIHRGIELAILSKSAQFAIRDFLLEHDIRELEFEPRRTTFADLAYLRKIFSAKIKLTPTEISLEEMRSIKNSTEIKLMRQAGKVTARAFQKIKQKIKLGMTERELAWELEKTIRECGGDELAFPNIVGFGENTAIPHYQPADRKLRRGDIIQLDFGAEVGGYKSDCSRVLFAGEPHEKFKAIYQYVLNLQMEALEEVRAGLATAHLAKKYESYTFPLKGERVVSHGLGHGVGLEIHELPNLKTSSDEKLQIGQILTIEPGRYYLKLGGVRIEDTVLVREKNCEILTLSPKTLASAILKL